VKDVIRVLIANNVDRILVVSFTNHTVDNTLEMLLDAGERSFVRLGGRSKHKRIAEFALEKLEDASRNPHELNMKYRNMRVMDEKFKGIVEKLQNPISEGDIMEWLQGEYPEQYQSLKGPSKHVMPSNRVQDAKLPTGDSSPSLFSQWIKGRDIQLNKAKLAHMQDKSPEQDAQPNHSSRVLDRPLSDQLVSDNVWMMSIEERKILFQSWKKSATDKQRDSLTTNMKNAKVAFESARDAWESVRDSVRRFSFLGNLMLNVYNQHRLHILQTRKIIGCTTAGAAKMIKLIKVGDISQRRTELTVP
jgi:hypothetical protein